MNMTNTYLLIITETYRPASVCTGPNSGKI
jgi:hypothetical protein